MSADPDSLLLVLPIPFRRDSGGRLYFESQACNGLRLWCENFPKLTLACPVSPQSAEDASDSSIYVPLDEQPTIDRIDVMPLPWAYSLPAFVRTYRATRRRLAEAVRKSRYLSFAIGGLVGDWASVAAFEARRQGRPYSVWTDRVEHRVLSATGYDLSSPRDAYRSLRNHMVVSPLMKRLERRVIKHADLGLFHGRDCYNAYSPWCRLSFVVHDIHLKPEDRIPEADAREKVAAARRGGPLRLVYAGRAAEMKGPMDWIDVMAALDAAGVDFRATWLGDGPFLSRMREEASRRGLARRVELPGFVGDRDAVSRALRDADLFVFCHKTPESPRCLVESLLAACPIVGYDSAYPRDLLEGAADDLLTPLNDPAALAARIVGLARDREALADLIGRCYELGAEYSDVAVFRHRSDLIKEHLGAGA